MDIKEKLQHFSESCMLDARNKANNILEEYKILLDKEYETHVQDETRRHKLLLKIEKEKIDREMNKELSIELIKLRKMLSDKRKDVVDKIFNDLEIKIKEYRGSDAYYKQIERQIIEAVNFAGEDEMVIYLEPEDMPVFTDKFSTYVQASKYSFGGGMRAVIPHKNILIDHSFEKKLADARENFHISIGGHTHE